MTDVSDDDAPEEITLNKGREEAEESRRNEKENSKRLAAELKEKRKARAEKQKEVGSEKKKKKEARRVADKNPRNENELLEKSSSGKRKRDASNSKGEGELAGKVDRSNMLDDSVVQLIRARETQVGNGVSVSKRKDMEEPVPKPIAKRPTPSKWPVKDGSRNSRIQIVSLQAKPKSAAINKALRFRNTRFFGSKAVPRSKKMLPTTTFVASV